MNNANPHSKEPSPAIQSNKSSLAHLSYKKGGGLKFKIISGILWNTVNSGASFIITIGTVAVLARLLKPEDFGMFAMITVVIGIMESFSDMGISAAVISYKDIRDYELSSLLVFNIVVGVFLAVLLAAASPLVVFYYKEPRLSMYLYLLALNFIITSPAIIFNVLMKKHMQFKILSRINIIATVIYGVTAIAYAWFTRNIISLVVGTLLQSVVSTVLNIYYGLRLWKPGIMEIRYAHIKRFLSFGLFQIGERIINRINWNIDYLIIGRFLGAQSLGFYYLAYNLMLKPIQKINPIITGVAFPALSEIQENTEQLKRYFLKMIRYIITVMAPIYLLFFVIPGPVILVLYGDEWMLSVPVLGVFAFLGILYSIGNPMGNLILAKGRADIGFWMNVGQTLFLLTANYIGSKWGIMGVAVSTLAVTLCIFVPVGFFVRYYLVKMTVSEYLEQLKKPILLSFAAGGVIVFLKKFLIVLSPFSQLVLLGGLFVIIYGVLLIIFEKEEIRFLLKTIKEYGKREKITQE